ncbi:contactin-like [Octopus vulgaris]|uniref:Contactin-like n=1 Tax=Octopus vulgaris TaxID=6645 RepID=A0AA36BJ77_OCTVU|nr:contactin-like [Octopus vulgaris]
MGRFLIGADRSRHSWFTSGLLSVSKDSTITWKDGTNFTGVSSDWWNEDTADRTNHLIYSYKGDTYKWNLAETSLEAAYICEIDRAEAFRIMVESRGIDYGTNYSNPNDIPRGPKIIKEPEDLVIVTGESSAFIECIAMGNPKPTYKWYREVFTREEVSWKIDTRYTTTNGRLTISNPVDQLDTGDYQCEASNKFGSVLSRIVQVSFGVLSEFPSDDIIPQNVRAETGAVFQCPQLHYKPAAAMRNPVIHNDFIAIFPTSVLLGETISMECMAFGSEPLKYHWTRENKGMPDRTTFYSNNRELRISDVKLGDSGIYTCHVRSGYTWMSTRKSAYLKIEGFIHCTAAKLEYRVQDLSIDHINHYL